MSLQANNEMLDLESDAKMKFFEERLASFDKTWPYDSNCNCSPEKMAEAGFYQVESADWPDLVRCFYCRKELDGWEPHENPWDEHAKRDCPFIKKGKKSRDLTVEEYFDLEAERLCLMFDVSFRECERRFLSSASEAKKRIIEMGAQKKARGKRRRKK